MSQRPGSTSDKLTHHSVVPISYKRNVGSNCNLRNFSSHQGPALNLTVAEALLATIATPPLFTFTSISNDLTTFEYIGADITMSNPAMELITEAYEAFGSQQSIACLLSVGCGHPGTLTSPDGSDLDKWNQFLARIVNDGEHKAQTIDAQMGHLGLYYRFRVSRGLEQSSHNGLDTGNIMAHTSAYLADVAVSRKMEACIDSLKLRDGVTLLEQLSQCLHTPISLLIVP